MMIVIETIQSTIGDSDPTDLVTYKGDDSAAVIVAVAQALSQRDDRFYRILDVRVEL